MDFESSLESADLTNYIDNSEWELLSIEFEKGVHTYACCPEPHPGKLLSVPTPAVWNPILVGKNNISVNLRK